jgi:hypothetical protein
MNERIRELAEQTGILFYKGRIPETGYEYQGAEVTKEDLQNFAELIVQEYEQFLPEICPWAKADEKGPMKGWHVQFVARKHFGME